MTDATTLDRLEAVLGYGFADRRLLEQALTHRSRAYEKSLGGGLGCSNEQLEFLGDAVLGFVVCDLLCREHPLLDEGQLSKLKAFFVSAANLITYAEQIDLGDYLRLGRGEEKTGGRLKRALLVDGFEALLGAIYLDGGIDPVRRAIEAFILQPIREAAAGAEEFSDAKTALQEALQSKGLGRARYVVIDVTGPDHQKWFTVEIQIENHPAACGAGLTKKAAEQAAARIALRALQPEESVAVQEGK